jgi:hypothetical protein
MASEQYIPEIEEDGNQHRAGRFNDIERQIKQFRSTLSDIVFKHVPYPRLRECCIDSLQKVQGVSREIHLRFTSRSDVASNATTPHSLDAEHPLSKAQQRCFLCLTKKQSQIAISIRCYRPTEKHRIRIVPRNDGTGRYDKITEEKHVESDMNIFKRLQGACYEHKGTWRKWIPFYGLTKVEEVTVSSTTIDEVF